MAYDFKNMPREEVEAFIRKGEARERTRARARKIVLAIAATVALGGVGMRCSEWMDERAEQYAKAEAAEEAKPTLQVFAPDLWTEFDDNEIAAEQKYKDAHIVVGGVVVDIRAGVISPTLDLYAGHGSPVMAFLRDSEKDSAAKLHKGSKVVLLCNGGQKTIGRVNLSRCKIGKVED